MDDNEGIRVSGYLTDLFLVFKHEIFFKEYIYLIFNCGKTHVTEDLPSLSCSGVQFCTVKHLPVAVMLISRTLHPAELRLYP